jgi:hypothetical protein
MWSKKAWDFVTEKYGTPQSLQINTYCCQPPNWTAKVEKRLIMVTVKEINEWEGVKN